MPAFYTSADLTVYLGDAREELGQIEAGSVQTIVTSPPYFGLRDYETGSWGGGDPGCDHEAVAERRVLTGKPGSRKQASNLGANYVTARRRCECGAVYDDRQIGLEESAEEYARELTEVFAACREALTATGTLWLNLGDTYGGATPGRNDVERLGTTAGFGTAITAGTKYHHAEGLRGRREAAPKAGDGLIGIPWMVAETLRKDGWRLIRDVIWAKTNPMPESVKSRPSTTHEYVFMFARGARHFYRHRTVKNQRSVWAGPTAGYKGDHYGVMPDWLARQCILLGSERGDLVLDPFAGVGTSLLQAARNGRRGVGVELSERNCEEILGRAGILATTERTG